MEEITTQTTTNDTNIAPATIAGVEQTTLLTNKENIMENTNSTITEAHSTTVQDAKMTNTEEQTITTTEIITVDEAVTLNKAITVSPLRRLTSACKNLWVKTIAKPDENEIKKIKEERRSELVATNSEGVVAKVIDEKIISSELILELHDGTTATMRDIVIANPSTKVQDIIEPSFGNDVATVKSTYIFDAIYETSLRGGETYTIDFTSADISHILIKQHMQSSGSKVIEALINKLSRSNINEDGIKLIANDLITYHYMDGNSKENVIFRGFFTQSILNKRRELAVVIDVEILDAEKEAFSVMQDYALLNNQGKVQIINTSKHGLVASSVSELRNLFANQKVDGKHAVDVWMASEDRPLFIDTKFDPSFTSKDDSYNLFKGFAHPAQKLIDIAMFKSFVKEVICSSDDKMYNITWSFLAQMLQDPTRKMGTALVLLSAKGTGKSSFVKVIGELLKDYFFQSADNKRLLGEFNKHLESTLLFYANELTFTDNKRVISKLKNVITEKNFTYEIKGGATYSADNFTRVIIDSNEDMAVVQTADERRFIYPKISEEKIGDTDYFNELHALFETEGFYESLMHDLMTYGYAPWEKYLKTPPKNEVTEEQMLESFMEVESFWLHCLEEGRIPYVNYEVTYDGKLNITNEAFYQSFAKHTRVNGRRVKLDSAMFGKAFKKHVLKGSDLDLKSKMTVDGVRKNSRIYETREKSLHHFVSTKRLNNLDYDGGEWIEPVI